MWQQASVFWSLNMRLHQAWEVSFIWSTFGNTNFFSPKRKKKILMLGLWPNIKFRNSNKFSHLRTQGVKWTQVLRGSFLGQFPPPEVSLEAGGTGLLSRSPLYPRCFPVLTLTEQNTLTDQQSCAPFFLRNEKTHWSKRQEKMWVK